MTGVAAAAGELQRSCALVAADLSDGRREDARLVTGEHRAFSLNAGRTVVHVPYPPLFRDWSNPLRSRTVTADATSER